MATKDKIEKITITRPVVFDTEAREVGDVCDVNDHNRSGAEYLVRKGKAVEGEVKRPNPAANKAVGASDTDKK